MTRRTHSTIDTLPAELRETITRMVVDADWPKDFPWEKSDIPSEQYGKAKPRYVDIVLYCIFKNNPVSLSSLARWAKELATYERIRTSCGIAKKALSGITQENASETQRAAAEMMTAHVIDAAAKEDLSPKEIMMLSGSVNELAKVVMLSDKYVREQTKVKTEAAAKNIKANLSGAGVDRKKIQEVMDEILGITKS